MLVLNREQLLGNSFRQSFSEMTYCHVQDNADVIENMYLVQEFVENGSLWDALGNEDVASTVSWQQR